MSRSAHSLWSTYDNMRTRCYNPKAPNYVHYGGRGVFVDARWLESDGFWNFVEDMGDRPSGFTLNRIDNDGPYSPGNCEWASSAHQSLNKRTSRWLSAFGETKVMREWAIDSRCVVHLNTFETRIARGWGVEEALITPTPKRVFFTPSDVEVVLALTDLGHNGTEIAAMFGAAKSTVCRIIRNQSKEDTK